ncbi:hypothetical protein AB0C36_42525, partial [Streptodolium elevatio]
ARLEKAGMADSAWDGDPSERGIRRRLYWLTGDGREFARAALEGVPSLYRGVGATPAPAPAPRPAVPPSGPLPQES